MNSDTIIHPKLQHFGLATGRIDAMLVWYRQVLGMTINHRTARPGGNPAEGFSAAFVSNDEVNHRIALFELPDGDDDRQFRFQHVAFAYASLDDLLGTYLRLAAAGIHPVDALHHGAAVALYYVDPDGNRVELNVNVYGCEWTATEHLRTMPPQSVPFDPDRMVLAHRLGASAWELHERGLAGEFAPRRHGRHRARG